MFFKDIVHEPQDQGPDHLVVRQSERALYRLMLVGSVSLLVYSIFFYRGAVVFPQRQELNAFGGLVQGVVGIGCVFMIMILFGVLISLSVNYFYTVYLIGHKRVVKIKYGTNFKSEVITVDLDQVMYTNTDQSGFMQSTFDYGDIHLHLATDEEMVLEDIPNPKHCVMKIEELKTYEVGSDTKQEQQDTEGNKEKTNPSTSSHDKSKEFSVDDIDRKKNEKRTQRRA